MNHVRCRAFTLAELVVGLVFLGVVLAPLMLYVSRIHEMNSAVGRQARREAWRTFNDQVLAAGIAPGLAPALAAGTNPAVPVVQPVRIRELPVAAAPGLARIVPLHVVLDPTVAEPRIAGAGLQLGAGAVITPLSAPTPPLPPIETPAPVVTPPDGAVIDVASLVPAGSGAPYTMVINIASGPANRVRARVNTAGLVVEGTGAAQSVVNALDLLNGVTGTAWAEYAGDSDRGDRAVQLPDGRMRWLVTTADGRRQTYEPSPFVAFAYRVDLGAPVLIRGTEEAAPGTTLAFGYADYVRVQGGVATVRVSFPQRTRAAFGAAWGAQGLGFQWRFGTSPGPFSGDFAQFFQSDTLSLWSDAVAVAATAVVPPRAISAPASWTIQRTKTALGLPVLSQSMDASGFYSPGDFEFNAPQSPDGSAVGRLSFENGAYMSTGPTLSIPIIP